MYSYLIVIALVLFLSTEKSFVHFSRTARRTFWYLLSCALGLWLVRLLQTLEGLSLLWVIVSAVLAASIMEDEVSKARGLVLLDNEACRRQRAVLRSPLGQGLAERVMDLVAAVNRGHGYTAGTVQLLGQLRGTTRRLRRGLHGALASASARDLNYVLVAVNLPALLEVAARDTVDLLTRRRVAELSTPSRAALVDAFQKLGMRHRASRQRAVRELVLATRGLELTRLKAYIDDGGDYHSCYKLIYTDLQGEVQRDVLAHIAAQGARVSAAFRSHSRGDDPPPGAVLKVLSDIDDTLFSSGGHWPAGVDARYPKKCFYPGALALFSELDRGFAATHAAALAAVDAQLRAEDAVDAQLRAEDVEEQGRRFADQADSGVAVAEVCSSDAGATDGSGAGAVIANSEGTATTEPAQSSSPFSFLGPAMGLAKEGSTKAPVRPSALTAALSAAGSTEGSVSAFGRLGWETPPAPETALPPLPPGQGRGAGNGVLAASGAETPNPGLTPIHIPPRSRALPAAPCGSWSESALLSPGVGGASPPGGTATPMLAPEGGSPLMPRGPRTALLQRAPSFFYQGGGGAGSLGLARGGSWGDLVGTGKRTRPHQEGSNLVFLSARPESYKGMTEAEAHRRYFAPAVARGDLDASPSMLLGSLGSGPRALLSYLRLLSPPAEVLTRAPASAAAAVAMAQMLAAKKLSRAREYAAIYPEAALVLVGDNGQGDVLTAEVLWASLRPGAGTGARVAARAAAQPGRAARAAREEAAARHDIAATGADADVTMGAGRLEPRGDVASRLAAGARAPSTDSTALLAGEVIAVGRGTKQAGPKPEALLATGPKPDPARTLVVSPSMTDDASSAVPGAETEKPALTLALKDGADEAQSRLMASFIHRVVPLRTTFSMLVPQPSEAGEQGMSKEDAIKTWAARNIYFHATHVGMAAKAFTLGLLDAPALHRVARTAQSDFMHVWGRYAGRTTGQHLTSALQQLNDDVKLANDLLPPGLHVELLAKPEAMQEPGPADAKPPSPAASETSSRFTGAA